MLANRSWKELLTFSISAAVGAMIGSFLVKIFLNDQIGFEAFKASALIALGMFIGFFFFLLVFKKTEKYLLKKMEEEQVVWVMFFLSAIILLVSLLLFYFWHF